MGAVLAEAFFLRTALDAVFVVADFDFGAALAAGFAFVFYLELAIIAQ